MLDCHAADSRCFVAREAKELESMKREVQAMLAQSYRGHRPTMRDGDRVLHIKDRCRQMQRQWDAHMRYRGFIEGKYDPSQPRVPAGNENGGVTSTSIRTALHEGADHARGRTPDVVARVASNDVEGSVRGYAPREPLNVDKATEYLHAHISEDRWGDGKCATNVANAIRSSGLDLGRPEIRKEEGATAPWAKDYGDYLKDVGFSELAKNDATEKYPPAKYTPQKGDVVIIQPISGQNPAGHIAMYDGKKWLSDFVQERDIWPNSTYQKAGAKYIIYRHSSRE